MKRLMMCAAFIAAMTVFTTADAQDVKDKKCTKTEQCQKKCDKATCEKAECKDCKCAKAECKKADCKKADCKKTECKDCKCAKADCKKADTKKCCKKAGKKAE